MSRKTRKLIWSAPLMAVLAVAGALAIFTALVPKEAAAHEAAMHGPPAPVTMLAAEAAADDMDTPALEGRNAVSIMWKASATTGVNASDAATHYRIDRSEDTRVWTQIEPSLADADVACDSSVGAEYRCHMDTDLEPNTTYYYRVFAMNAFGISAVSVDDTYDAATTEPVGAPMAVRDLEATDDQEKQIDLSWDAPTDDGGADILLYCIVVANPSGTLTDLAVATNASQCKTVTVASTDDEIATLTNALKAAAAPGASNDSVDVIVIEATDDDDMPVTSFEHLKLESPNIIRLRYRVYAVNDKDGKLSTEMDREISASVTNTADGRTIEDAITPDEELRKPAAPMNLRAVVRIAVGDITSPEIRLYWTVPDSHPSSVVLAKIDSNATRTIEVTLWDGTEYAAIESAEITCQGDAVRHANAPPAQCVITSEDLTKNTNIRTNTYRVRYVIDDNGSDAGGTMIGGDDATIGVSLPLTEDNEEPDLPLIRAFDDAGFVAAEDLRSRDNPGSPKTAIDLLWQRNDNAEEDQPTGYVIEYSVDEGVTWKTLRNADTPSDLGTNTIYTHSGVSPGKKYTYRVFPWHSSAYGLPKTIMASSEPADVPDPVQNLRVTAAGEDKLRLDWNSLSASNNGGHPVIGYLVQVSNDPNNDTTNNNAKTVDNWTSQGIREDDNSTSDVDEYDPLTTEAGVTTYTYKGTTDDMLSAGSRRWFRVFAITLENDGRGNTGGDELATNYSSRSEDSPTVGDVSGAMEVDGITDAIDDPSDTPADQVPGAPVGLTAEPSHSINLIARTDRGVLLLWNEPAQTPQTKVSSYVIERQVVGTDTTWQAEGSVTFTGDTDTKKRTSYVDTENPEMGEVRMYRVGSKNIAGTTWATAIMYPAAHGAHVPDAPTLGNAGVPMAGLTDNNDPGSIKLTWTAGENANVHWVVVVLVDANGDFDVDNSVWTQASAQDSHTVAMETEGLIPGNYRAMVIAGMHDSDAGTTQWSTWQNTQFAYPQ